MVHEWLETKRFGIWFRYCKKCYRLETKYPTDKWKEYPRFMTNELTGERMESSGYHHIIKESFDPNHVMPIYRDFGDECWMCGEKKYLYVQQKDWPEAVVNLCGDCYMMKNEEWKKGDCKTDGHKYHPVLRNPRVCYRCGVRVQEERS